MSTRPALRILSAVLLLALSACAGKRIAALETDVAALRAEQEAQAAEIVALKAQIDALPAPAPPPSPPLPMVSLDLYAGATEAELQSVAVTDVDRATLKAEGVNALISELRFIPHRDADGVVDGMRVSAIRADSLVARLGLKNGDIVLAIRGAPASPWIPLTDAAGALAAYEAVQASTAVELLVKRRGQVTLLRYQPA